VKVFNQNSLVLRILATKELPALCRTWQTGKGQRCRDSVFHCWVC